MHSQFIPSSIAYAIDKFITFKNTLKCILHKKKKRKIYQTNNLSRFPKCIKIHKPLWQKFRSVDCVERLTYTSWLPSRLFSLIFSKFTFESSNWQLDILIKYLFHSQLAIWFQTNKKKEIYSGINQPSLSSFDLYRADLLIVWENSILLYSHSLCVILTII